MRSAKRIKTLHFQQTVEALGKDVHGSNTFAPYFAGWAKRDPLGAESRLDELADSHSVSATALLDTTSWLDPTPRGLTADQKLASGDPEYAAAILGRWIDHLSPSEFKELLQIIGGHDLQHASAAVDLLGSWMYHQKPFDGPLSDFAWRCIEHGPSRTTGSICEGWHFDELASKLTEANPDVGFAKFHQLLIMSPSRTSDWELLDMDGGNQWWKTLRAQDRLRVFRILLETSLADHTVQEMLSWRLKDLLDQGRMLTICSRPLEVRPVMRASLQNGSLAASQTFGLSRLLSLSDSLTIPVTKYPHLGSDGYRHHD
jgi:hypothetical protein